MLLHHDHSTPVSALAFSPDGSALASGGPDGSVWVRSESGAERLVEPGPKAPKVFGLTFLADGGLVEQPPGIDRHGLIFIAQHQVESLEQAFGVNF